MSTYEYLKENIEEYLKPIIMHLLKHKPEDPITEIIKFIKNNNLKELREEYEEENTLSDVKSDNKQNSEIITNSDGNSINKEIEEDIYYNDNKDSNIININNSKKHSIARNSQIFRIKNNSKISEKSNKEAKFLKNVFNEYFFLKNLTDEQKSKIIEALELKMYEKNTIIYNSNEIGNSIYIIKEGVISSIKKMGANNSQIIMDYNMGDLFGDNIFLLNNSIRKHTTKAKENCILYKLEKNIFDKILEKEFYYDYYYILGVFDNISTFQSIIKRYIK